LYGSSPANVLANYGELEKSGRFFPEVGGLGLTRLEFVDLGNGIDVLRHNAMHQRDLQTRSTMHAMYALFDDFSERPNQSSANASVAWLRREAEGRPPEDIPVPVPGQMVVLGDWYCRR